MRPRMPMIYLLSSYAHDPAKCERFADKIMRHFKSERAIGRKTGTHFC